MMNDDVSVNLSWFCLYSKHNLEVHNRTYYDPRRKPQDDGNTTREKLCGHIRIRGTPTEREYVEQKRHIGLMCFCF